MVSIQNYHSCVSCEICPWVSIRNVIFNCSGHFAESVQIRITRSQSGQIHVGPLLMPHLFSSKQSGQIWKPHGQFQQNSFF